MIEGFYYTIESYNFRTQPRVIKHETDSEYVIKMS